MDVKTETIRISERMGTQMYCTGVYSMQGNEETVMTGLMTAVSGLVAEIGGDCHVYIDNGYVLNSFNEQEVQFDVFESEDKTKKVCVISHLKLDIENLSFGEAIRICVGGNRISRSKWNENVFVVYQRGYPEGIPCNQQTADAWGMEDGDIFKCEPYFQISTENGSHMMWTPNTEDLLAEDWFVLDQ